jgi:hypothetical protein
LAVTGGVAQAAPHAVSINVTPNQISSGDPLLIYGRLTGPNHAGRPVVLFHKIAGQPTFTPVQHGTTDANGFYSFVRAAGVVTTNRRWFARSVGADSRKVAVRVAANVSLDTPPATVVTNQPVTFTGHLAPAGPHVGDRVFLQSQSGASGEGWRDIDRGKVAAGGAFSITHRFTQPGTKSLRVVFKGDRFNTRDTSDEADLVVQQRQNPKLTLNQSSPSIKVGESLTLSGQLTGSGNGGKPLTLYAHENNHPYVAVATTTTASDGSYSFTQQPLHNTVFQVRGANGKPKSAQVFEGVRDTVTIAASSTSTQTGTPVAFTGTVTPDKAGHIIYLQKKGADGDWHNIEQSHVKPGSTYEIDRVFGAPGTKVVRVLVPGGPVNQRGVSDPVTITVAPFTPPAS